MTAPPTTVLRVAHRAANTPALLRAAAAAGADLAEADVRLRRGRLELRHARRLGPFPLLWEPWYLVASTGVTLPDLAPELAGAPAVMLDLKGWQPWLGRLVRDTMAALAPGRPYVVSSRRWWMLDAFEGVPEARVAHSVGSTWALWLLDRRLRRHPTWAVGVDRGLLSAELVARLLRRAEVVLTWPVDSRADADRALALGVRGLIADDLAVLDA